MAPIQNKLTILYRVEPGCLGPDGDSHVDDFCKLAGKQLSSEPAFANHVISWCIEPRRDKTLPEMQFKLVSKVISHQQAETYLKATGHKLDTIEDNLIRSITSQVNEYLGY